MSAFSFLTPPLPFGAAGKTLGVTPVTPAAKTTLPGLASRVPQGTRLPLFGSSPLFNTPGQRLGSAPAPLASPSIGLVASPLVALAAAVAGARAAMAAGNK